MDSQIFSQSLCVIPPTFVWKLRSQKDWQLQVLWPGCPFFICQSHDNLYKSQFVIKFLFDSTLYSSNWSVWLNCFLFKYHHQGFEVLCPDKASMQHTVLPSVDAFRKGDMEGARNLLRVSLQVLLVRAVNTVILASEDLVGILPDDDPLLKKCIDPMDALVREAIVCTRIPRPWYASYYSGSCVGPQQ